MTGRRDAASGRAPAVRRLFVAVDPSPDAVQHLGAVVDQLEVSRANTTGRSTRLAARERWHITLAFLGDVPEGRVPQAAQAVGAAAAAAEEPIRVWFAGGGRFGRGRFTILWAGVDGDLAALRALAGAARRELRRAHLPHDTKPFRPHLTISRPGGRVAAHLVAADVAALASYVGPQWSITELHLVESQLGPDPCHTRLRSFHLGPARRPPAGSPP